MDTYNAIGIMSGTSVDGLDICYCSFELKKEDWSFQLGPSKTITFPTDLGEKLTEAINLSAEELNLLHVDFGQFIGQSVNEFLKSNGLNTSDIDLIASHGHTVFHQPNNKMTLQIGDGASIAAITGCKVVNDFRTLDVALGGNGAPLVPIGDQLLFSQYDACLNLGGFANISFNKNGQRIAYDIAPVNVVINHLSKKLNQPYDEDGILARDGQLIENLLEKLNQLPFYQSLPPKSLGLEWVKEHVFPLLDGFEVKDLIRTFTEHCAQQIAENIEGNQNALITGGGAFNSFLTERISSHTNADLIIPEKSIIEFKEAIIFAFLGVLRSRNEINTLKSVTGASRDSVGGCIYNPFSIS